MEQHVYMQTSIQLSSSCWSCTRVPDLFSLRVIELNAGGPGGRDLKKDRKKNPAIF